jgi:endonuclease/exonuclease/phosphatase family metal-dependent hydrolase
MTMLKLISSNIRFDNPADGKFSWNFRKEFLVERLSDFQPDIIGTQEGREPQLRELESLLRSYEIIAGHRQWIEERMYPCLFVKKGQFQLIKSGDIWLSETPHIAGSSSFQSAFPRLCTWSVLAHTQRPLDHFLIINTHLDHVLDFTRVRQVQVLISELQNELEKFPTIIMGDFNESPDGETRKVLTKHSVSLIDPWNILKNTEHASYHQFNGNNLHQQRIDWLLHTPHFEPQSVELDTSHKDGLYPSDHFPLKVQLILS